ncbi:hypothetical protein ACOSQ3_003246 [Xanthoceras sorbifolium]
MNPWRSLHGFMEESMELPCPKLRHFSQRRGKAWRRSKIVGEQIEELDRRTDRRSIEEQRNWFFDRRRTQKFLGSSSIEDLCKFFFFGCILGGDPISN